LHASEPLIGIARKYSIVATSNILSLHILVYHIMLHTSVTKEKDTAGMFINSQSLIANVAFLDLAMVEAS
jgi:hypothetical protein